MANNGTFILADIGGYTSFLSGVGITHGKEITEHLLNRLIKTTAGRWKVANVMGDCVFFYAEKPEAPAETYRGVRALYESFQDAQLDIASGSTCRCGACDRTEDLSLKFVVHDGEYEVQNIGGRKELMGSDIVLATRLLKNSVPVTEYIITTEPSRGLVEASGLDGTPASDELDGMGPTDYVYIDLGPVRIAYEKAKEFYVSRNDSMLTATEEIDAPAEEVWSAMKELEKRKVWQVTIKEMMHIQGPEGAVGEVHSCVHGGGSGAKIVHATIAMNDEGMRKTERVWITPPVMKDTYLTMGASTLANGKTEAWIFTTFKPRYPVLSHLATPIFKRLMHGDLKKDMAGLKEFCETGKVVGREPAATAILP